MIPNAWDIIIRYKVNDLMCFFLKYFFGCLLLNLAIRKYKNWINTIDQKALILLLIQKKKTLNSFMIISNQKTKHQKVKKNMANI